MYDVDIEPEVKNKRKRKRMFEILEKHPGFAAFAATTATDYGKIIVSTKTLNPKAGKTAAGQKEDRVEITVIYQESDDMPLPEKGKNEHKFTIQRTAEVQPADIKGYVNGENPNFNPNTAIQALNIMLAKFPSRSLEMVPVGRNKYFVAGSSDPALSFDIGGGLVALKGYYTSVRPSVGNLLCNLNVCTTAFYK